MPRRTENVEVVEPAGGNANDDVVGSWLGIGPVTVDEIIEGALFLDDSRFHGRHGIPSRYTPLPWERSF